MQKELEQIINSLPAHLNQLRTKKLKEALEKLWVRAGTEEIEIKEEPQPDIYIPKGFENVRELRKYDVVLYKSGPCRHYHIIMKISNNIAYALCITSDKGDIWQGNIVELLGSRFLHGYACLMPIAINMSSSHYTFIGIFDNKKAFDNVITQAKADLVKLLNLNHHGTKKQQTRQRNNNQYSIRNIG